MKCFFVCSIDGFFADESNMQQGTTGKRKAPVPLTDSFERKKNKVFYHKGIFYLQARVIRDRFINILFDRT